MHFGTLWGSCFADFRDLLLGIQWKEIFLLTRKGIFCKNFVGDVHFICNNFISSESSLPLLKTPFTKMEFNSAFH